jgi:hypothetical protein
MITNEDLHNITREIMTRERQTWIVPSTGTIPTTATTIMPRLPSQPSPAPAPKPALRTLRTGDLLAIIMEHMVGRVSTVGKLRQYTDDWDVTHIYDRIDDLKKDGILTRVSHGNYVLTTSLQ